MRGTAVCHGAATIITGFATGKAGAYGIGLENETTVELDAGDRVISSVNGESGIGDELATAAVSRVSKRFGIGIPGARVLTKTNIPLASGLKSSSVAANAIVLATIGALAGERGEIVLKRLNKEMSEQQIFIDGVLVTDESIINLGIDAAFDAKVTATGAMDDASAAYFGGYTLTDNTKREIVFRGGMEEGLDVLIYLPKNRIYSGEIDVNKLRPYSREIDLIWEQARQGRIYSAINLNGMIHSIAFKQDVTPAVLAIENGALAAGLSGTGPAVVALSRDGGEAIIKSWEALEGEIIRTKTSNKKARLSL